MLDSSRTNIQIGINRSANIPNLAIGSVDTVSMVRHLGFYVIQLFRSPNAFKPNAFRVETYMDCNITNIKHVYMKH